MSEDLRRSCPESGRDHAGPRGANAERDRNDDFAAHIVTNTLTHALAHIVADILALVLPDGLTPARS
jgi:hypothetical protein